MFWKKPTALTYGLGGIIPKNGEGRYFRNTGNILPDGGASHMKDFNLRVHQMVVFSKSVKVRCDSDQSIGFPFSLVCSTSNIIQLSQTGCIYMRHVTDWITWAEPQRGTVRKKRLLTFFSDDFAKSLMDTKASAGRQTIQLLVVGLKQSTIHYDSSVQFI